MAKKSISQKKAERQQQENQALQRVFNVFLLGLAAECYLLVVYRGYISGSIDSLLIWHRILQIGTYLGLAALVGGAVVGFIKRADHKIRKITAWTAGIGAFLALSGFVITTWFDGGRGATIMCTLVPILTLLGLVYHLFQHECFASTVTLSAALFAVWACMNGLGGSWKTLVTVGAIVAIAGLVLLALLTRKVQQGEGKWKELRIFSVECDYCVLYAVLAVSAVVILLALLIPSIAYYLMWVLGISLFAELVYYTTKLM